MTRFGLRIAVVSALVVGASLAIFFGLVTRNGAAAPCTGCRYSKGPTGYGSGLPVPIAFAKVSIPKGTSGNALGDKMLYWKEIPRNSFVTSMALGQVRGEVAIRTIPAGANVTAADFALRGPIYYPTGYPKRVPASQIPAKMSRRELPAQSFSTDFAVAPGVWVDGATADAALDMHVANGTLVGYCRSVRAFEAHNPDVPFATKCWRK